MSSGSGCTNPQNPPRVILVVRDAAVADPPLSHDGVKARIGHGIAATATRRLGAIDERINCGVAAMLFFDFTVSSAAEEKEYTAYNSSDGND